MFSWMRWLLKKLNLETDAQRLSPTMDKLNMTLKKLKKKVQTYKKKASQEVKKEKEFRRAGDEKAASRCSMMKRLYEQQIEQLQNFRFQIKKLIIKLEGVKATTETVDALKIGEAELQEMQREINIDDGDEINELMASLRQIQDSLRTPSGAAADFDEDKLEAQLEEREGADPVSQRTAEEDAASQAEMEPRAGLAAHS